MALYGRLTLKHQYTTSTKQKDWQLLARVPFSMQLLKMEQSYETNFFFFFANFYFVLYSSINLLHVHSDLQPYLHSFLELF